MMHNPPPEYNKKENAKRLREGLENHIMVVAEKSMIKFGSIDTLDRLKEFLEHHEVVRFPAKWSFGDDLGPGQFARLDQNTENEDDGFTIKVNPAFEGMERDIIAAVLYMIVKVNYGKIAKNNEAELFGSSVLGIKRDEYHEWIERLKKEAA